LTRSLQFEIKYHQHLDAEGSLPDYNLSAARIAGAIRATPAE
jgi:hypothetical protein